MGSGNEIYIDLHVYYNLQSKFFYKIETNLLNLYLLYFNNLLLTIFLI